MEIEPEWFGAGSLPDAYSEALFPHQPALIEITAISDASLSGEDDMHRAAQRIYEQAGQIKRGSGAHLYCRFLEESGYQNGKYFRRRKVSRNFQMTDCLRAQLQDWLRDEQLREGSSIRLTNPEIDVVVEWKKAKQHRFNFHSTMPPEAHSLTDNPIYTTLETKNHQLNSSTNRDVRCVFLADVGSTLLRRLDSHSDLTVSGRDIIAHFLSMPRTNIDVVCVFSPLRSILDRSMRWNVTAFTRPGRKFDLGRLRQLADQLPPPRFEGYQARSLHQQKAFAPAARGWHIGDTLRESLTEMTLTISARAVVELLAGRITQERFGHITGLKEGDNVFKRCLDRGEVISSIRIERRGIDEDDDALVIQFERDAAVAPFRLKSMPSDSTD